MSNEEKRLIDRVSKFTRVFKNDKIIEITDEKYLSLSKYEIELINQLRDYKYMLQYYIE